MVCEADSKPFDRATVMGRHQVTYFRCMSCGFIATERPYWLDEAYTHAIASTDVGLVSRSFELATITSAVILTGSFDVRGRFLDYGGGYGLLVRLMRDRGYDFLRLDPHCENILAAGFECLEPPNHQFELATAFEVVEHLADPVTDIGKILAYAGSLLFSTLLVPDPPPTVAQWWYYAPEAGQHVSFHTRRSLEILAERLALKLHTDGTSTHIFTDRSLPAVTTRLALARRSSRVLTRLLRSRAPRSSLQGHDAEMALVQAQRRAGRNTSAADDHVGPRCELASGGSVRAAPAERDEDRLPQDH